MTRKELKDHMIELAAALPGVVMSAPGLTVVVKGDGRVIVDEDDTPTAEAMTSGMARMNQD